jgi:hypothetical protein
MIYQIRFQTKPQVDEKRSIKPMESIYLESHFPPSFDTIRRLVDRLYNGAITVGSLKIKPCPNLNAIRLKKQTTVLRLN